MNMLKSESFPFSAGCDFRVIVLYKVSENKHMPDFSLWHIYPLATKGDAATSFCGFSRVVLYGREMQGR